jgi:hypothetical protein
VNESAASSVTKATSARIAASTAEGGVLMLVPLFPVRCFYPKRGA